jgi:two-component system sensor histidine kinase YesM
MIRFISVAVFVSTIVAIFVSGISTVVSMTNKSTQMAMKEAEVMAANTKDNFDQYQGLIWSAVLDNHIQNYLSAAQNRNEFVDDVYGVLDNVCNTWENINFIAILPQDGSGQLIKGKAVPNWMPNYLQKLESDYESSMKMRFNAMKMSFTKEYNIDKAYTLNIYYPLYSTSILGQRLGLLCVNVNDANLNIFLSKKGEPHTFIEDSYFVHKDGKIITGTDPKKIGTTLSEPMLLQNEMAALTWNGVIIYKKLDNWEFYYVTRIRWWELAKDSMRTVVLLIILLYLTLLCLIRFARRMVTKAYEPWGNVVKAMAKVSDGDLAARLQLDSAPDMSVVAAGFNGMMEQIIKLMNQVKEEQFQLDQIRMSALQSQIQPHFLYNTLDCIHWQALVNGNKDISNMVKALAAYYRTCLSKGHDIITIEEELAYIKNYLYIQKIRYEDILTYEIDISADFNKAIIPKLTLQPLVENAIYHGIKKMAEKKGCITIRVSDHPKGIGIAIADNGVGMREEEIKRMNQLISKYEAEFGYGVRNVNRRIQLYFGQKYGINYSKNEAGGVTANVLIPNLRKLKGGI